MAKPSFSQTKMTDNIKHKILTCFIASIWLANGFFCKILNLVPRHQQIVARILGNNHSRAITVLIGISETTMAIWILSAHKTKLNAIIQIAAISAMNILEFILAPDLLLWGKFNSVFAILFIMIVFFNEYHLNKKTGG